MKLMTKAILKAIPGIGETVANPNGSIVHVKYFNPCGTGTWYITEFDGEDIMYGLCCIHEAELGYVSLKELKDLKLMGGIMGIERDLHYKGTLQDAMNYENY